MINRYFDTRSVVASLALISAGGTVLAADTTPPTATAPVQTITKGTLGSAVPFSITWSAEDASGIKSYALWRSTNGGPFVRQALATPTATSRKYRLPADNSYRFFVRAYDNAGNVSTAKYGPTFVPTVIDDRGCCEYFSSSPLWWKRQFLSSAYKGTITTLYTQYGSTRNQTGHAVYYFTGRDVAYVAAVGGGWTYAKVRIDGFNYANVSLNGSPSAGAQIVFSKYWPTLSAHMIEIGSGGFGYSNVDAIVVNQ